ncbi:MAG: hypothetical protein ACOCZE_00535 [Planctomycetota bacterium]
MKELPSADIPVYALCQRQNHIDIRQSAVFPDQAAPAGCPAAVSEQLEALAERIRSARSRNSTVMLAYGAHLIKNGGGPLLRYLVENSWVTHLATQGAGIIHDWEFAFQGLSSESVRENVPRGCFGHWDETGRAINLSALLGAAEGLGLGEAVGRLICQDQLTFPEPDSLAEQIRSDPDGDLTAGRADLLHWMRRFEIPAGPMRMAHPFKQYSVTGWAYECRVPLTVHPGIGYDIYTNHPMFHAGAIGRCAGSDARRFAGSVMDLSDGVYLSVGSAIMSPQVFEKALSAANSLLLARRGQGVSNHLISVIDIQDGGDWDWSAGEPPKDHPAYYLRFCKSFYRMGGTVQYICCDNVISLHTLCGMLGGS